MEINMQNIIVLDDEQEIADLLEVYLANEGYQVFKFYRAEGVLDCIQENEISLAIRSGRTGIFRSLCLRRR